MHSSISSASDSSGRSSSHSASEIVRRRAARRRRAAVAPGGPTSRGARALAHALDLLGAQARALWPRRSWWRHSYSQPQLCATRRIRSSLSPRGSTPPGISAPAKRSQRRNRPPVARERREEVRRAAARRRSEHRVIAELTRPMSLGRSGWDARGGAVAQEPARSYPRRRRSYSRVGERAGAAGDRPRRPSRAGVVHGEPRRDQSARSPTTSASTAKRSAPAGGRGSRTSASTKRSWRASPGADGLGAGGVDLDQEHVAPNSGSAASASR